MPRGRVFPNGSRVAALRGESGLTQVEIAVRAGYGLRTISKIEAGQPTAAPTLSAIAEVLARSLSRRIQMADLLAGGAAQPPAPSLRTGELIVAEHIQLLDLDALRCKAREAGSPLGPVAHLTDTLVLRNLAPDMENLSLYYPARGQVCGHSLSNPDCARWLPVANLADGAPGGFELRIERPRSRRPATRMIQHRVEYRDAFAEPRQHCWETTVQYPTESFTMIVRFGRLQPDSELRGCSQRQPADPWLLPSEQPVEIEAGQLAYWRVSHLQPGQRLRLEWGTG